MARYSVATTKDNLSSLIDKALAGEEVVITRHGKATISFTVVIDAAAPPRLTNAEWTERLKMLRESLPPAKISSVEMIRQMREESEH
jgi:antitoxin (DNA-binding transcriptional repressor) of toxin-antitoxin stability system